MHRFIGGVIFGPGGEGDEVGKEKGQRGFSVGDDVKLPAASLIWWMRPGGMYFCKILRIRAIFAGS